MATRLSLYCAWQKLRGFLQIKVGVTAPRPRGTRPCVPAPHLLVLECSRRLARLVWGGARRFPGDLGCTLEQRCRPALRAGERRQGRSERGPERQPPAWACPLVLLGGQHGGAQIRSSSRVQLFQPLWTAGSLRPRDFRGRNAGVGYLFQRPFPTQGPQPASLPSPAVTAGS